MTHGPPQALKGKVIITQPQYATWPTSSILKIYNNGLKKSRVISQSKTYSPN